MRLASARFGAGLSLALVTMFASLALSDVQRLEFYAVLLTLVASVYIGSALQGKFTAGVELELTAAAGFALLALAGL